MIEKTNITLLDEFKKYDRKHKKYHTVGRIQKI